MNEREDGLSWIENEERTRQVFQEVLLSPSGLIVLTQILNYIGWFSTVPEKIDPKFIAFGNWLLTKCGILHPGNLYLLAEKLAESANYEDLTAMRRELSGGNGSE